MKRPLSTIAILIAATSGTAADPDWRPVATELLQREKPGFGGLCGMVVDHKTGELFVMLSDRGIFRSADHGATWTRTSTGSWKGRSEAPGCWLLDPTAKSDTMVSALVYGSPIAVSSDRAANWNNLDAKSSHIDWCAVDWTDPERTFVLALKHESGGLLLVSHDGGKSFAEVGKGFGAGWVFDNKTAVVATAKSKESPNSRLLRTTDGGKTFQPAGDNSPVGKDSVQALPKWRDGSLYWLTSEGLIVTRDKGATWKKIGDVKDGRYGPIFGKDAKHMFVLTKAGIIESTDGGATWSKPMSPPDGLKGIANLTWLDYDPKADALYMMVMGSDLWRWQRGPAKD
jgi:photosystem II stability/assembly factor-like uncharacterized protein